MAARKEVHRHRRFPRRLLAHRANARLAADHDAPRRAQAHDRVLPRIPAALRADCVAGRRAVSPSPPLPFIDLHTGDDDAAVRAAIARVIDSGWFVLGPEVERFENEFASASGAPFAV